MINLRDRLIVDYTSLQAVAKIVLKNQNEITLIIFTLAILFEFFGEWNFFKVIKRLVSCFIILVVFGPMLKGVIDLSFQISNSIIDNCKNTEFCTHYLKLSKIKTDTTLWSETVNLIKNFSDFWLHSLISLIFKIAFIFTIQLYSLVFALTNITYPLVCVIGILPVPGEKAFVGIFQSLLWLFLSPVILSIVIVLLASVTNVGIGPRGEVGLEGLLHLMIISLFSLGSLFLSWTLCKGEGVAGFGSSMAQMGTSVMAMTAIGGASSISKGLGSAGRDLGSMGAGLGKSELKDYFSNKVSSSLQSKGLSVGVKDLAQTKTGILGSTVLPKASAEYQSLSAGEKMFHKIDSVINAKENSLAKQNMIRDFRSLSSKQPIDQKLPVGNYKSKAMTESRRFREASSISSPPQKNYQTSRSPNRFERPKANNTHPESVKKEFNRRSNNPNNQSNLAGRH